MSDRPTITVAEIAALLEAEYVGDGEHVIEGIEPLELAGPEMLSWVGTPKMMKRAATSKAGALLIPAGSSAPSGSTVIPVPDPDAALIEVLERLAPSVATVLPGVHPTAEIGAGAKVEGAAVGAHVYVGMGAIVGAGTQLHPGAYVGAHARIGRDCVLWPNVVVRERVTIGDRVVIHPNATVGADGYGYLFRDGKHRKIPQIGTVIIEDDVEIGANSTVDRAKSGVTRIGQGTKIDNLVQIGHNCDVGAHCILVAQCGIAGSTSLGQYVVLAGQAGATDHIKIGNGVQVGAKSAVFNDIPDNVTVSGIPAHDNRRTIREWAAVHRLPQLLRDFRQLTKRVDRMEQTFDASNGD